MAAIKQNDVIDSVADAFQYISYYHPKDYLDALALAYEREESPAARDAIAQILTNSKMSAQGRRPVCQDTGLAVVFVKLGMNVEWSEVSMPLSDMIHEGVRRAYMHPDNKLRASVVKDPTTTRLNSKDNTPAIIHYDVVPGNTIEITVACKRWGIRE
jgi:fumarate hydratase class I